MAIVVVPNVTVASEGPWAWQVAAALKTVGWKVVSYGDGSSGFGSYNTGGYAFPTGAIAANAWYVIKQPTIALGDLGYPGGREFLIARGNNTTTGIIIVRYARSGFPFNGGSPSATVKPTSTDQVDMVPSQFASASFSSNRLNMIMQDAAPFGFHAVCWLNGGAIGGTDANYHLWFEPVFPAIAVDPEPYILSTGPSSVSYGTSLDYNEDTLSHFPVQINNPYAWFGSGLVGAQFAQVHAAALAHWAHSGNALGLKVPDGMIADPFTNKDNGFPIFWTGDVAASGLRHPKGVGQIMRWTGTARSVGSTLNNKARLVAGHVSWPWDGLTVPLI